MILVDFSTGFRSFCLNRANANFITNGMGIACSIVFDKKSALNHQR